MTYEIWQPRRFHVELRDPDGDTRWVVVPAAIGFYDARSQARYQWPLSTVLQAKEDGDG
jgi:hypothetical protein